MNIVTIEALDHFGYGIAHLNEKIVFVENALPDEVVKIEKYEEKKKYAKARVLEYIEKSKERKEAICPYFDICGGCSLMFYDYNKTLEFKKNKVNELLVKNKISYNKNIEVIENKDYLNYRNKISLKIVNGDIGYFKSSTHELVEINECKIANAEINKVIANYKLLGILNGKLTIRVNSNNEVLIIINTLEENYNIELEKLKNIVKIVVVVAIIILVLALVYAIVTYKGKGIYKNHIGVRGDYRLQTTRNKGRFGRNKKRKLRLCRTYSIRT